MNLSNFKVSVKTFITVGITAAVGLTINTINLSDKEKQSALEVAYVAVEGLSQKVPCNGVNLLTMNMLGEKNKSMLAEEVRSKVMSDLEIAYEIVGGNNTGNHSAYYWWYSEWKASSALDRVVDRCFGL